MKNLQDQIDKLKAEHKRISARRRRRARRNEEDWDLLNRIGARIRALEMKQLEGVPDAVVLGFRPPRGDRCEHLSDALGTIIKVKRKSALVTFAGDETRWNVRLSDLLRAEEKDHQGMVI